MPEPEMTDEVEELERKHCLNPWKACDNTDIALIIMYQGKELPICSICWREISESDYQWETKKIKRGKTDE